MVGVSNAARKRLTCRKLPYDWSLSHRFAAALNRTERSENMRWRSHSLGEAAANHPLPSGSGGKLPDMR